MFVPRGSTDYRPKIFLLIEVPPYEILYQTILNFANQGAILNVTLNWLFCTVLSQELTSAVFDSFYPFFFNLYFIYWIFFVVFIDILFYILIFVLL